ncbi:MAG: Ser/Gly rich, Cys interspersed [Chloroflexi bacterium]|nr:Ser/Gly rich, Cys interspersed [Chloroflexota bacterium]
MGVKLIVVAILLGLAGSINLLGLIEPMSGPAFLAFFAVVVLTLVACRAVVAALDNTTNLPAMLIPSDPDPYQLAYLRVRLEGDGSRTGAMKEVTRLVILDRAVRERFGNERIESGSKRRDWVGQDRTGPPGRHLARLERASKTSDRVFRRKLPEHVARLCEPYERWLAQEQLIRPPDLAWKAAVVGLEGAGLIALLGGLELITALLEGGHIVLTLFAVGVVGLALVAACTPGRLSRRGRRYLERLRQAFSRYPAPGPFNPLRQSTDRSRMKVGSSSPAHRRAVENPTLATSGLASGLVVGAALFGFDALEKAAELPDSSPPSSCRVLAVVAPVGSGPGLAGRGSLGDPGGVAVVAATSGTSTSPSRSGPCAGRWRARRASMVTSQSRSA